MKRKLWLLNLILIGLIAFTGSRLRQSWLAARAREQALLKQSIRPVPPPSVSPLPAPEPVVGASYLEIAQKMLFSKDRNPTVTVEPPPPPPPPPPPKPMPALPVLYGVLDIGDGPTAVMSEKTGARHHGVHPGETVGDFKLLAVNSREIVLEWDGKEVRKRVDELVERPGQPGSPAGASAGGPTAGSQRVIPEAPQLPPNQQAVPATPSMAIATGIKACQPGDGSPSGTVAGGYRKVVSESPFGQVCRWEEVK